MSGCAVGKDGALLDADQIDFYNDPDDVVPISGPSRPLIAASSWSSISSTTPSTLNTFFNSTRVPAVKLAGARCSQRVSRPSAKVLNPNNMVSRKRQAADDPNRTASSRRRVLSPATTSDHDTDVDDASQDDAAVRSASNLIDSEYEQEGVVDEDTDDGVIKAYEATKSMGDIDRQVRVFQLSSRSARVHLNVAQTTQYIRSKDERTADVRTIFKRDKTSLNPDTGEVENGHWCAICQ
jgi:hypothetical protein